jgi:hypothetical protein
VTQSLPSAVRAVLRTILIASTLLVTRAARADRLQVCVLAFNTADEIAAFRSQLPAEEFEVVDLSPHLGVAPGAPADGTTGPWLAHLCRPDVRCDVVVYSAEFAGRFFGAYGTSIGLQEMEEQSCRPRCDGLFHHPQEVFLLACNTLATKDEDRRTPDDYRRVLFEHGFDQASAERVVAMRYGPLGPSFREAARRVFMGVPRVYGFSSVAPSGDHTAALLDAYFRAKGDYRRWLERAQDDPAPNRELLAAFRGTSLVQVPGLSPAEAAAADRADVCRLYDESESLAARLRVVGRLLDRDDFLAFLPTIEVFVGRHPADRLQGEERRLFAELQDREPARREVLRLVRELDVSALQMELAHLARHLDWITPREFRDIALAAARRLLARPLTSEVVDIMCELPRHEFIGEEFGSADLPERLFDDAEGIRFVDCLSPVGDRVSARLARGLDSPDLATQLWAAYALSRRLPLDEAILEKLADRLDDPSADLRERVRWIMRAQAPLPGAVRRIVAARAPALAAELAPPEKRRRGLLW